EKLISKRIATLRSQVEERGLGILGELNGSARAVSIDEDYFRSIGLRITTINNVPGKIVHRIVPEGTSLDDCRAALEKLHAQDPSFVLGYVPDKAGDRGILVWFDSKTGSAKEIEAQQLFCLTVAAELSWLVHTGQLSYAADGNP